VTRKKGDVVRIGALVLIAIGAMGLMTTANLFLINPARFRDDFVGLLILPGVLIALGVYLLKRSRSPTVIDAEIVDDPPENPAA